MKANAIIERGTDGTYDVNLEYRENLSFGLFGQGDTVQEAIADFYNSRDEIREVYADLGKEFPNDLEFEFKYDVASFLASYAQTLSLAGLEKITGINQRQLSHYVTGHRRPGRKTVEKIEQSLHRFGEEISKVEFV